MPNNTKLYETISNTVIQFSLLTQYVYEASANKSKTEISTKC